MDAAIVGGGIIGCAVARELARRGVRVTVFEQRSVAGGATYASAGVLAPYVEAHQSGPLQELTVRSLSLYDSFVEQVVQESGLSVEYARCGSVEVACDDSEAAVLEQFARARGAEGIRWIDGAELRNLEPALGRGFIGGVLVPSHGYVAAPELTLALARAAERMGVSFDHAHVESVQHDPSRPSVRIAGRKVTSFDRVIVAAGSWSSQLAGDAQRSAAVYPVKGQLLRLKWTLPAIQRILWSSRCYVVPRREGQILVGATIEDVGFDERITETGVGQLLEAVRALLPAADGAELVEARAGLRPATSDGLPLIGPSRFSEAVVYATGHFRNGIVLAPLTASVVADLVLGRGSDPTLDRLSPHRFGL